MDLEPAARRGPRAELSGVYADPFTHADDAVCIGGRFTYRTGAEVTYPNVETVGLPAQRDEDIGSGSVLSRICQ